MTTKISSFSMMSMGPNLSDEPQSSKDVVSLPLVSRDPADHPAGRIFLRSLTHGAIRYPFNEFGRCEDCPIGTIFSINIVTGELLSITKPAYLAS